MSSPLKLSRIGQHLNFIDRANGPDKTFAIARSKWEFRIALAQHHPTHEPEEITCNTLYRFCLNEDIEPDHDELPTNE
jgi:hypothetical protein